WPGNVRELRNAVAQRIALGDLAGEQAPRSGAVPPSAASAGASGDDPIRDIIERNLPFPIARDKVVEVFEERYVSHFLEQHGGNVTHAAQAAGIGRRYFQTIRGRNK
ncbi:MAG TPA: helix-turn-helix domain-containing protein, partial [Polyangiaceae bacterium]